jgi:soluble lytic murein transglycosylase-like protein
MAIYNEIYNSLPRKFKPRATAVTSMIIKESAKHDFDPVLVLAIIKTESSFNPLAIGGVGEIGLMQIRPETAEWIAKKKDLYASEVKPKEYSLKVMRHYKDTYAKLVTRSSFTLIAKATEAPSFSDIN